MGQLRDSYNGSMIDPVKNSVQNNGGQAPYLQNDQKYSDSGKRNQMNYDNNAVLPDLEMRDKVKNALSISSSQVATHQCQVQMNN